MADAAAPPLVVALPEAIGRRMRLGPFPSSRHALKFAAYAAVGGAVAAVLGAVWTVPFLGVGFLLSVYQPDGRALDEQFGEYVQFRWRARPGRSTPSARREATGPDGPYVNSVPGVRVAIVAVGGLPVAFLPPSDARALFDAYREMLRSLGHGALVQMGLEPLTERPYLPAGRRLETGDPEASARSGYGDMVTLLCRRRYRRHVLVAVWEPNGANGTVRLEREVERLADQLRRLGLAPVRLRGAPLRAAAHRVGWSGEGAS